MQFLQTAYDAIAPALPWLTAAGALMAILSMVAIPWLVVRIPDDYFSTPGRPEVQRGPLAWTIWLLRNTLATVLVIAGVIMLVLPGQGILTILVGIACSTFPGKYRLERRLVRRPKVLAALNWIRRHYDKPPLDVADD
ncbi:MAG: hypothetical protein KDH99_06415 [Alcanivoracaceae bacterium]|nr:hypothetical protein [Alcanivoracaceae bacterium]